MSEINQRYVSAPVNVERNDIEWLWKEMTSLFQPNENQRVLRQDRHVTIKTGQGLDESEVRGSDLTRLLDGGFLRAFVSRLILSFSSLYENPQESRSLVLSIDCEDSVEIRVFGVEGWIERIRGKLDPYLRSKAGHNRRYRWTFTLGITGMIGVPATIVVGQYLASQVSQPFGGYTIAALIVFLAIGAVASGLSSKIFSLSKINIANTRMPWYARWAEGISIAVVAGMVLSIILSALSWLHL